MKSRLLHVALFESEVLLFDQEHHNVAVDFCAL